LIGTDPIAGGRFGEVWKGSMHNKEIIAVKILRVYVKSDMEKLLKVAIPVYFVDLVLK
jgi:predicted unusual protein kinase regulating ubiquinone biosynthesis (AarF/ABC1/UbiB family)